MLSVLLSKGATDTGMMIRHFEFMRDANELRTSMFLPLVEWVVQESSGLIWTQIIAVSITSLLLRWKLKVIVILASKTQIHNTWAKEIAYILHIIIQYFQAVFRRRCINFVAKVDYTLDAPIMFWQRNTRTFDNLGVLS